jgi:hypothetical protein
MAKFSAWRFSHDQRPKATEESNRKPFLSVLEARRLLQFKKHRLDKLRCVVARRAMGIEVGLSSAIFECRKPTVASSFLLIKGNGITSKQTLPAVLQTNWCCSLIGNL